MLFFRRRSGISQEELGYRANLHQTYISGIERGTRQPTVTTVDHIAKALGVQTFELFIEREDALKMWFGTFE